MRYTFAMAGRPRIDWFAARTYYVLLTPWWPGALRPFGYTDWRRASAFERALLSCRIRQRSTIHP
jgi:hypothetical protein